MSEQPETQQIVTEQPSSTALVVKTDKVEDSFPKPDPRGHLSKAADVQSLNIGGVALSGKLVFGMEADEQTFLKGLLDGSGSTVKIAFQPGSKAKIHGTSSFYSGSVKEDGLSGQNVTAIHDQTALVGNAHAGIHCGRAKIYKTGGEVYTGAVKDSVANGRGVLRAGDTTMRGSFVDGAPVGKFHVASVSDGSSYSTQFDPSGKELLAKRSKRKLEPEPDEVDEEDEVEGKQAKTSVEGVQD